MAWLSFYQNRRHVLIRYGSERFASPQAAVDEQHEEWRISAAFRSGQERAHLLPISLPRNNIVARRSRNMEL